MEKPHIIIMNYSHQIHTDVAVTLSLVVGSSPVSMAWASLVFHCSATSLARGSSGFGALSNAWIDSSTVRICNAGDHLSAIGGKRDHLVAIMCGRV